MVFRNIDIDLRDTIQLAEIESTLRHEAPTNITSTKGRPI